MKKILPWIFAIVLIGVGVGYYMYNKPVPSLEKQKADVSVSADQLLTEYEADEKTANDKYLGKVVEVSGKVLSVATEEGKNKIHLETSNPIAAVIFELEAGKNTGDLKAGDQASIKGLCTGYLSDVILVQSTVVKN